MRRIRPLVVVCLLPVALGAAQGAARDATTSGTASISGVVVDDTTNKPVRHALVSTSPAQPSGQLNTDDAGRFTLVRLAPGSYTLKVSATRYLRAEYGASHPAESGIVVTLADRQSLDNVTIRLTPAAAIAGVLLNSTGEPLANASVRLWKWGFSPETGERTVIPAQTPAAETDDRGVYRLANVPPGEYFVRTSLMTRNAETMGGIQAPRSADQVTVISHDSVLALRQSVAASTSAPPAPAVTAAPAPGIRMPTYYPGTARISDALPITVRAGEEQFGIDFRVQTVLTANLSGKVTLPGGLAARRIAVQLWPAAANPLPNGDTGMMDTRVSANGEFTIQAVPPGDYVIGAQAFIDLSTGTPDNTEDVWSATLPVTVNARDLSELTLTPAPGMAVSGRVLFDGDGPPPDPKTLLVRLRAVVTSGQVSVSAVTRAIDRDGRFSIVGVTPGKYFVDLPSTGPGGATAAGWHLKSAVIDGRDAADVPVDLSATTNDAIVTVTNRRSSLSGTVATSTGVGASPRWVIVFPVDRTYRLPRSRRVDATRSSADGVYSFASLPPGDYFIATVEWVEPNEWLDQTYLRQLEAGAIRVGLGEGEQKRVMLRIP